MQFNQVLKLLNLDCMRCSKEQQQRRTAYLITLCDKFYCISRKIIEEFLIAKRCIAVERAGKRGETKLDFFSHKLRTICNFVSNLLNAFRRKPAGYRIEDTIISLFLTVLKYYACGIMRKTAIVMTRIVKNLKKKNGNVCKAREEIRDRAIT